MLKQNANEGCSSCASLAGFVLSFIACFILLVITPSEERVRINPTDCGHQSYDIHEINIRSEIKTHLNQ